jgi:hypothetical protein
MERAAWSRLRSIHRPSVPTIGERSRSGLRRVNFAARRKRGLGMRDAWR